MSFHTPPLRRSSRVPFIALATVVVVLATASASHLLAAMVRPVNLEEMTERAGVIFHGRCTEVETTDDSLFGGEVTVATFAVTRAVKGDVGPSITVRLLKSSVSVTAAPGIVGHAPIRVGEEVVLFLYPESSSGLTSPIGLGQGKFTVVTDKNGRKLVANPLANGGLFRGMSDEALRRVGPRPNPSGLGPSRLLDLAATLTALPVPRVERRGVRRAP